MKYYIPTSSLNFNNILSTESISPKSFYERRGFGYSRWFTVEENSIEHLTILYDKPHMFERPQSDIEDHPMLIEIDVDDEFSKLADGVFYTEKTIYLNPWQTKFIFFAEKDKTTALSLSDSSLETKLVRLYQRKIYVHQFEGSYPILQKDSIVPIGDIDSLVEKDYVINKMKGLLYGYYIGANLSSTKENVQKLDALREIQNIFSSVLSSYDKTPSSAQRSRLNELFDYLDSQQPIYADLEKEVGNRLLVDKIFAIFKRHGYVFTSIDRTKLIYGLQDDGENNQSITWINREIARAKSLMESSKVKLNPDDAEIIVSSKDKVTAPIAIADNLMSNLFVSWVNEVLCSKSFNGKVNSIKEGLSDEITKSAKNVIGSDWENSPVRTYLNQLRRHVRGEEFNQSWDNGVLSSISAVLIKGDEWEQLLNFMQSKGMYDYRIAFALYGVLNGFANMTRDFTDLLLTTESGYLSKVYREMYGQLLEKSIPETTSTSSAIETKKPEIGTVEEGMRTIVLKNPEEKALKEWQNEIRVFAASVIKRDKQKLLNSLEDAFAQNGNNQDYFVFITMLDNFEGWKPGKNGPSTAWTRLQEHYVPDYNQRIGKPAKKQSQSKKPAQQEKGLFDGFVDGLQNVAQTVINAFTGDEDKTNKEEPKQESSSPKKVEQAVSRVGKSILDDKAWIYECASLISDSRANRQFIEDMEWFVGNHNDTYNDKKKGIVTGYYAGHDRTNERVLERIRAYMDNKLKPRSEKMQWLADIYVNIPINKIIDYISKVYGV
ncbi:MAG: hypothetical protein MJZ29_07600 [Bacteroidaceae bacterium]|nr:hypothetical protein [Bacteroidaceae bacterium]